ncbi:LysR family transcriptional regulator [Jannaschia donghaensis]|uniref:Gcv operon activator n=1 Tax=Jannaschia donghaensis TaxID=420998 RepID=A0A0M6YJG5_9RHOB|nr:LysR family transcriptional regulator [Jannaschia donghaensis]CTQ50501.1 Gcv operon activator [Jannaschia donghaensis]
MNHLPHLNHLRSFEAAARSLSFTTAADELNYTQSAVSSHIRSLEEFIGRPLFVRFARSLALTSLGEAYLPTVRYALAQVDAATEAIMSPRHDRRVVISCPISLASNWLTDRLTAFAEVHPDIAVTVHGRVWKDEDPEVADIRIVSALANDLPKSATVLWTDRLRVLAAPDAVIDGGPFAAPAQIAKAGLIHNLGRPDYWAAVGRHFQLDTLDPRGGTRTNSLNVAMEMAARGNRLAVVPAAAAAPFIARGLLIAPLDDVESPWVTALSDESLLATREARLLHAFLASGAEP